MLILVAGVINGCDNKMINSSLDHNENTAVDFCRIIHDVSELDQKSQFEIQLDSIEAVCRRLRYDERFDHYIEQELIGEEQIEKSDNRQNYTTYLGVVKDSDGKDIFHVLSQFYTIQAAISKHGHSRIAFIDMDLRTQRIYEVSMPNELPTSVINQDLVFEKGRIKIEKSLPAYLCIPQKGCYESVSEIHEITFHRNKLEGDFDGDGIIESLYESVFSNKTGEKIESISYQGEWDCSIAAMCELDPAVKLKSSNGMTPLRLNTNCQIFGIMRLINLGDINESKGDEIGLIVDWADWSNMNTCSFYSYINGEWKKQFDFDIHETTVYGTVSRENEIEDIIEKEPDGWYYNTYDWEYGYSWKKLELPN